ncbi:hypothetical protein ARMA_1825 [Ardenticatena maritima]|uniref:Uncharacterized protein n=1 Tax=Ardenticatena maritima TaxID=872965 RepID=A0A0M8K9C6_9CHLR|nr:hypothetical protein ARMA_1825 [Ardenticatena maritima]
MVRQAQAACEEYHEEKRLTTNHLKPRRWSILRYQLTKRRYSI